MAVIHSSAGADQRVDQLLPSLVARECVRIRLVNVENQHWSVSGCDMDFDMAAVGEQGTHQELLG